MKEIKLSRSQGSNLCSQYLTVHNYEVLGLSIKEIVELPCPETQVLILTCTSCHFLH